MPLTCFSFELLVVIQDTVLNPTNHSVTLTQKKPLMGRATTLKQLRTRMESRFTFTYFQRASKEAPAGTRSVYSTHVTPGIAA